MDARRYDRNADQLSQIFWHYTRKQREAGTCPCPRLNRMLELLEEALRINDEVGILAEKGLIWMAYTDTQLKRMTKKELLEVIRFLESVAMYEDEWIKWAVEGQQTQPKPYKLPFRGLSWFVWTTIYLTAIQEAGG